MEIQRAPLSIPCTYRGAQTSSDLPFRLDLRYAEACAQCSIDTFVLGKLCEGLEVLVISTRRFSSSSVLRSARAYRAN